MHLRVPSYDHGVLSAIWGFVLGLYTWLLLLAAGVSDATAFIFGALAGAAIFLYVRIYGEDRPGRT